MVEGDRPPISLPPQVVRDAPLTPGNLGTIATQISSVALMKQAAAGVKKAAELAPSAADLEHTGAAAGTAAGLLSAAATYSAIVQGKAAQHSQIGSINFLDPSSIPSRKSSDHHGKPAITFTTSEKIHMVEKLRWVLVGKFSHGRPTMAAIKAFFKGVALQGNVNFAFADPKHVFIECSGYLDYYSIWLNLVWNIDGYDMRMFQWSPSFSALIESPIAPVWIRVEGLPLYLFEEITLLSIASVIGRPIKVDARNVTRSCLSSARICVELDVSKPLIDAIWISIVDEHTGEPIEGRWAKIYYDVVPPYCSHCSHIGHPSAKCKRQKEGSSDVPSAPNKMVAPNHRQGAQPSHKMVWKQIGLKPTVQLGFMLNGKDALPRVTTAANSGSHQLGPDACVGQLGSEAAHQETVKEGQHSAAALQQPASAGLEGVSADSGREEEDKSAAVHTPPTVCDVVELDKIKVHAILGEEPLPADSKVIVATSNTCIATIEASKQVVQIDEESSSKAELTPQSTEANEWQLVVSSKKRGSREKGSKSNPNRLVFDHNTQDVRSGHSEPRQIQLLRPSWADQVEEECELPTVHQTVPNKTEDTGEIDSDLRAFIKAHFLESSAAIEAALRKRQTRPQQVTPEDSTLAMGVEQVDKGHESATKESKEDFHTTRGEDKPRQVHFHDLVTMHMFEKEANRRSERRAPKNASHTEKDFKVRVLEDQHHEGWPLKELQGKHAHTPGTKAKSNDPG